MNLISQSNKVAYGRPQFIDGIGDSPAIDRQFRLRFRIPTIALERTENASLECHLLAFLEGIWNTHCNILLTYYDVSDGRK